MKVRRPTRQKRPKLRWETLAAILTHVLTVLSPKLPFAHSSLALPGMCEKSLILALIKVACLCVSQIFRALARRSDGQAGPEGDGKSVGILASPFLGAGFRAGAGEEIQAEESQWKEQINHKEHAEVVFLRTSGFWDVQLKG